jgi:hypothetical protein
MSSIQCANFALHRKKREKRCRKLRILWTLNRQKTWVECAICLHNEINDQINDLVLPQEYLKGTPTFEAIKTMWSTCKHKKLYLACGSIVCQVCMVCCQ